jgi:hypothetical protein
MRYPALAHVPQRGQGGEGSGSAWPACCRRGTRNKTLIALAGAEPALGAQHPVVQRLQFFLSESRWDPDRVNARRLELLLADPATALHDVPARFAVIRNEVNLLPFPGPCGQQRRNHPPPRS